MKVWAKTQAVVAKSSGEAELYSVVKGACEGLGLKTLCCDLGMEAGVRLELDASAAKGIIERQGIAKVRHIDVNCLWLQDQLARKIVPLEKIPGSNNTADLMTKHLINAVILKHLANLYLEHREGRAGATARLHSIRRKQRQTKAEDKVNQINDQFGILEGEDYLAERGEHGRWVRIHRRPRTQKFVPSFPAKFRMDPDGGPG